MKKNFHELKESISMMNSQRNDIEKNYLIEEGKKVGIDEVIKHNKFINNSLKSKIQNNVILLLKVQNKKQKKDRKYNSKSFKN